MPRGDGRVPRSDRRPQRALNAIVSRRDREVLLDEAGERDDELVADESRGWMHGLPQAIKDLAETRGLVTTMGSPLLRDYVPDHDSLMVAGCAPADASSSARRTRRSSDGVTHVQRGVRRDTQRLRRRRARPAGAVAVRRWRWRPDAAGRGRQRLHGIAAQPGGVEQRVRFPAEPGSSSEPPARDKYLSQMGTEGPMGRSVVDVAMLLGTQAGYDRRDPLSLDGSLAEFADVPTTRATLAASDPSDVRVGWLGRPRRPPGARAGDPRPMRRGVAADGEIGCAIEHGVAALPARRAVGRMAGPAPHVDRRQHRPGRDRRGAACPGEAGGAVGDRSQPIARGSTTSTTAAEIRTRYFVTIEAMFERYDVLALPTAQVWPFPIEQRWPEHIGDRAMDTYHRWMEVFALCHVRGPTGHQRAGRFRRPRSADGHAVDRSAPRRCRTPATGPRLRADDHRSQDWHVCLGVRCQTLRDAAPDSAWSPAMLKPVAMERLSPLDVSFLHIEDADRTAHMHVASIAIFEGPPPAQEEFARTLSDRLHLVPRWRQRVQRVPFQLARPVLGRRRRFRHRLPLASHGTCRSRAASSSCSGSSGESARSASTAPSRCGKSGWSKASPTIAGR